MTLQGGVPPDHLVPNCPEGCASACILLASRGIGMANHLCHFSSNEVLLDYKKCPYYQSVIDYFHESNSGATNSI